MSNFNIEEINKKMKNIDDINNSINNSINSINLENNDINLENNDINLETYNTSIHVSYNDIAFIYLLIIIGGFNFDKLFKLTYYDVD